jgi:hypothetical protein
VFVVVLWYSAFHHKVFRLIEMFKYYCLHLYNQTSRSIDKSEQNEVNKMNNHSHHNNEPRPDENRFGYILKRALLHRADESTDTAQHRSAIPEYQITIEHGSIWLGQECVASPQAMRCQHTDYQEMRS